MDVAKYKSVGIDASILEHASKSDFNFEDIAQTIAISKTNGYFTSKVTALGSSWRYAFSIKSITQIDVSNLDTSNIIDMDQMFLNASSLKQITGLENWNTSKVKDMSSMFYGTSSLKKIKGIENWDTSSVVNMSSMFNGAISLENLNLKGWNTVNVKKLEYMFSDTPKLRTINGLEDWNTKQAVSLTGMFYNAKGLEGIKLNNWNIENVESLAYMFYGASSLKNISGLEDWNTSNVRLMESMFYGASSLNDIGNLSEWNTSNVIDMSRMFWGTKSLSNIGDIGKWDTRKVSKLSGAFVNSGLHLIFYVANSKQKYDNKVTIVDNNKKVIAILHSPTFYYQDKGNTASIVRQVVTQLVQDKIDNLAIKYPNKIFKNLRISNTLDTESTSEMANAIYIVDVLLKGSINYVDEDGTTVKSDKFTGVVGENIAIKVELPTGYELANEDEKVPTTVAVTKDSIQPITVKVKKIVETKTGSINYIDEYGKTVKSDKLTGKVGDNVEVNLSVPTGYELANKDEKLPTTVPVTQDGIQTVTVNIKKIPEVVSGHVNYVDENGKTVKSDSITGTVGTTIDIKISLPTGYELANKSEQVPTTVKVNENGIQDVVIKVKKIAPSIATNQVPQDKDTQNNQLNFNQGWLDNYGLTQNMNGQSQIKASGWHAVGLSNQDSYRYMIVFDNTLGHEVARQKLTPVIRNDVRQAYSNVNNSNNSGFNMTIDIPNDAVNHSLSLVARYSNDATNGEGQHVDYWFGPLKMNETNQAYLDSIKSDGKTVTVSGWHATNQAAGRPYHYIIAFDQTLGHEIARQEVKAVQRPDVAKVYGTIANAVNAGFSTSFNLIAPYFNDNIQFLSRYTDDPSGNGNSVDYWFNPVNHVNRANLDSVDLSSGRLKVAGWHATDLSQFEPNHFLIVFDNTTGRQVTSQKVALEDSPDVARVYSDTKTAGHSRFNFDFGSLNLQPGHSYSLVSRYSADGNGNGNDGAHTDSWMNMGILNQSAYNLDNTVLSGNTLTFQGWRADDQSMVKHYAYAILLQNGKEIGRQRLNQIERADVAKVYPSIYQSKNSGFKANFKLPTVSLDNLQLVLRNTDDPNGNGNNPSDVWINVNRNMIRK